MKIIISGCAGFIGYHLAHSLLIDGYNVLGIDSIDKYYSTHLKRSRLSKLQNFKKFKFIEQDILNIKKIKISADIFINLSAQPGVRLSQNNYHNYIDSNLKGFYEVLNYCLDQDIGKLIFASSSSVYSDNKCLPFSEKDQINEQKSFYGMTKYHNEQWAKFYFENFGLSSIGLRFFTVYGPYGRPDMAYYKFTDMIKNNTQINLYNNGNTYRDMTYINDIVNGIRLSMKFILSKENNFEIFNLGNGKPVQTIKLIKIIEKYFNKKAIIKKIENKNEVHKTWACLNKSKNLLNYHPSISINEGMTRFFDWYEDYNSL